MQRFRRNTSNMHPSRKKVFSYVSMGAFYLLDGIEFSCIMPTAWLYLNNRFGADTWVLGMMLSSYSVAGIISRPLIGKLADLTGRTKMLMMFCILCQASGSVMYFLGISPWVIVVARFVSGFGTGVEAAFIADLTQVTAPDERMSIMSKVAGMRQVGVIAGPASYFFLRALNFYIGPFILDQYTAPGLFTALLWLCLEIFVAFFFKKLPQVHEELERLKEQEKPPPIHEELSRLKEQETQNHLISQSKTGDAEMPPSPWNGSPPDPPSRRNKDALSWRAQLKDVAKREVIALYIAEFVAAFAVISAGQAIATPGNQVYLEWTGFENSFFFFGIGVGVILSLGLVNCLSWWVSDRVLLLGGLIVQFCSGVLWLVGFHFMEKGYESWHVFITLFGTSMDVFVGPLVLLMVVVLLTKVVPVEKQGFAQGVNGTCENLGYIFGPLWVGTFFIVQNDLTFSVLLIARIASLICVCLCFHNLRDRKRVEETKDYSTVQYSRIRSLS